MMQWLLTLEEKGTGNPSMMMGGAGVCGDLVTVDLEPMSHASVLLPFNLRKSLLIQHSKTSDEGGGVDGSGGLGVTIDPMVTEE